MEGLQIGEGHGQIRLAAIERIMKQDQSSYCLLLDMWRIFGRNLPVNEIKIKSLDKRLAQGVHILEEIPYEVLCAWKAEEGRKATVKKIYDVLIEIGLRDIAERIENAIKEQLNDIPANLIATDEKLVTKSLYKSTVNRNRNTSTFFIDENGLETDESWLESLIEYIKRLFRSLFGSRLDMPLEHTIQWKLQGIPNSTSIHVAASKGMYEVVSQLLRAEPNEVRHSKYLLHACVSESAQDHSAIIHEKVKIIELLLKMKYEWIEESLDQCTPILQPCIHQTLIERLVDLGANINACSIVHGTILHRTSDKEAFERILKWITKNGFNRINYQDSKGWTPLIYAIKRFGTLEEETLKVFQELKADFNSTDKSGFPALYHALWRLDDLDFIEKLVNYGAEVNTDGAGPDRLTAAHAVLKVAEELKFEEVVAKIKLLAKLDPTSTLLDIKDAHGATPLHYAMEVKELNTKFLDIFLENGADFNAADEKGDSVLFEAIRNYEGFHSLGPIQTILANGGNVNHESKKRNNAAHVVVQTLSEGHLHAEQALEILKCLTLSGFNQFNEPNKAGLTPFECALKIENLDEKIIDFFYANGPDLNYNLDLVLFHSIITYQNLEYIRKIINSGANVNYRIESNKINVAHAVFQEIREEGLHSKKAIAILELLISQGFTLINKGDHIGLTPLHYAMQVKSLDEKLLAYAHSVGANFNSKSLHGFPVIYHAIMFEQNESVLKQILDYGGIQRGNWKFKFNPLHIASLCGNYSALKFLLDIDNDFGFDINSPNQLGNTPMHMLFSRAGVNYEPILELLLSKGANFEAKNFKRNSPLLHWIKTNKWEDGNILTTLKHTINLLPITQELASEALTVLVGKKELLQKLLFVDSVRIDRDDIAKFVSLFLEKGGKLLVNNEEFAWSHVKGDIEFKLSQRIKLTSEILEKIHAEICLNEDVSLETVDLCTFVKITNAEVRIETIFASLLACRDYDTFVGICKICSFINIYNKLNNEIKHLR